MGHAGKPLLLILFLLLSGAMPASAQNQPVPETVIDAPSTNAADAENAEPREAAPEDTEAESDIPKKKEFTDMPQVRLRILDKVRAQSRTYDLDVGHTVAYGNIRIRPRSCRKSSPLDDPESASFLQIWEIKPDRTSAWVFSGWMFASSPSLSAMDHAVYDVTVLDCRDPKAISQDESQQKTEAPEEDASASDPLTEYIKEDTPSEPESAPEDTGAINETPSAASAHSSNE